MADSAPTDSGKKEKKKPLKVAQLLHAQQSLIESPPKTSPISNPAKGRRQTADSFSPAPCHMCPNLGSPPQKNADTHTSAVVCCTLSHSTTDLRVGRLSPYVDQSGCQSLEKVKEELEGGGGWGGVWRGTGGALIEEYVPLFLLPPPHTCKKTHRPTNTRFLFLKIWATHTHTHTRSRART